MSIDVDSVISLFVRGKLNRNYERKCHLAAYQNFSCKNIMVEVIDINIIVLIVVVLI